jgi:hypothetical protein
MQKKRKKRENTNFSGTAEYLHTPSFFLKKKLSPIFGETKTALTMPRKKHVRGTMVYGLLELELVEKVLERGTGVRSTPSSRVIGRMKYRLALVLCGLVQFRNQ